DDMRLMFGLTSLFPPALASPLVLGAVMLGWMAAPLGLAIWRFRR
ncbi:MAG: ABC transporter permease, partial [Aquitalea sp.]|nr:ABC transporter permease [Aquitalea sp.]